MWVLVLAPLVAGILCGFISDLRRQVMLSCAGCLAAAAGLLWGRSPGGMELVLPGIKMSLNADGLGLIMAGATLVLWLAALLFSTSWFSSHRDNKRYMFLLGATCSGVLLTFLGGDFLTLLVGFELMSLASWGLVVHTQSEEAYQAGGLYLFLGVGGGLLLVTALGIMYHYTGSLAFAQTFPDGAPVETIALLMLAGFGIKAGMVPVHIWLPEAHPAAPVPASALLSGILIKTGAYGILRTLEVVASVPETVKLLGLTLLLLGFFTMSFGVVMALLQHGAKRMLAFHSISQMGYILIGFGAAAYLGSQGGESLVGGVYHMLNHSMFKALLFLVAGAVYLKTRQLDLYRLGGLWRVMPATFVLALVASLGIAGFPGLNGFASKTMLHHGLFTVAESLPKLAWIEKGFVLVSAGTACSFIKFMWFIFGGKQAQGLQVSRRSETVPMLTGMALLAGAVICLGAFPYVVADKVLAPALAGMTYFGVSGFHAHIYSWHSLADVALVLLLGAVIFWAGCKWHVFHLSPPPWLSARYWGGLVAQNAGSSLSTAERVLGKTAVTLASKVTTWERAGEEWLQHLDCRPRSRWERSFSVINLNFNTLLVIAVLSLILLLYFPLSGSARGF